MNSKVFKYILDFEAQTAKLNNAVGGIGNMLKGIGVAMAAAFSVNAVKNFVKEAMAAYDVEAKAQQSLLTALKGRSDVQQRLIQQAGELQKKTLFGDEETVRAQSLIAAFVKEEEKIRVLIPLVQDFATAKQMDLASAADLVTKTLAGEMNALGRYGIQVEGAAGSVERLTSIQKGLNDAFGGQAEAAAKVGTGAITQLGNAYSDLTEVIGKLIVAQQNQEGSLTKILTNATSGVTSFLGKVATVSELGLGFKQSVVAAIFGKKEDFETINTAMAASVAATEDAAAAAQKEITTYGDLIARIAEKNEILKKTDVTQTAFIARTYAEIAALEKQKKAFESLGEVKEKAPRDTTKYETIETRKQFSFGIQMPDTTQMVDVSGIAASNIERVNAMQENWQSYIETMYAVAEVHGFLQGGFNQIELAGLALTESLMQTAQSADVTLDNLGSAIAATAAKSIRAYIAEGVAGAVSKTLSFLPFPANVVMGAMAATAATALFNSVIPNFEFGGVVPGNSFSGDRMLVRVNSGEEIIRRDDPRHVQNRGATRGEPATRDRLVFTKAMFKRDGLYVMLKEAENDFVKLT